MYTGHTLLVVASARQSTGRCKYCGARILWATVAADPARNRPARTLPFDGRPIAVSTVRNDDTGVAFEQWPVASLHRNTCTKRPSNDPKARTDAYHRKAAQDRQGRMW